MLNRDYRDMLSVFCGVVFQIGVAPRRIDIVTAIEGVDFEEARRNRVEVEIEDLRIPVLSREDLVRNKKAAARPQDLADVSRLEAGDED